LTILNSGASPTARPRSPRWRRRRPSARSSRQSCNIRLESCGYQVPLGLAANSPTLLVVAVEDLCWRLAMDAWQARRPKPWQLRRRAVWRAERVVLTDKQQRLKAMAKQELAEL
jgi:hypothetical protein